ncbi:MAG: glycosyltransferase family 4 protein [Candidatus Krumholzibacteriota bacterium]|nr:glycosyltransferase family 4 protein [Candidatus Krumholzibacteriota bacterium]
MRILICYPWLSLGGAPNTAISNAKGLKEIGHEVVFFTKTGGMYEEKLRKLEIPVVSAPHDPFLPHLHHLNGKAFRILEKAIDEYSIDIIHSYHHSPYFLAQFAALRKNIPLVFTAVWFVEGPVFPAYPGSLIFVAREFLDDVKKRIKGNPAEMAVIPNRIDLNEYHPGIDFSRFQKEKQLPDAGWKIAFMSRVDRIKFGSLRHAVQAVELMATKGRDVTLAIAGDGGCFEDLKQTVDEVNIRAGREIVILLGQIIETPQFLSWADIVLGIGRCTWEGMACGKPAIVVGENGIAGIAEPAETEMLQYYNFAGRNIKEPVDPQVLADTIEELMTDETHYRELSEYSRKYVIDNYDYKAGAVRVEEIYRKELLSDPLTRMQKIRVFCNALIFGYGYRLYIAWRIKLRGLLGRGKPDDKVVR